MINEKMGFVLNFASVIKKTNAVDKANSNKTSLQRKAGQYTEEQTRLLLCVRKMVKSEVERQLKELSQRDDKIT